MIEVIILILSDWKRYTALHTKMNPLLFLAVLFRNPGMYFSVLYRIERYLLFHHFFAVKIIGFLLYPFYFLITYYILDIDISPKVKIGKGLYIHNRGIVFTDRVTIGDNLTLIGPLTLGAKGLEISDDLFGPTLGNKVTVFAGARLIGSIHVGNNVYIGANAVVVKNCPSNCVMGGIPAKILRRI
jgi:serine acetyltransferase